MTPADTKYLQEVQARADAATPRPCGIPILLAMVQERDAEIARIKESHDKVRCILKDTLIAVQLENKEHLELAGEDAKTIYTLRKQMEVARKALKSGCCCPGETDWKTNKPILCDECEALVELDRLENEK